MKRILIILLVITLLFAMAAPAMAHPTKGPNSMPAQSFQGLHRAVGELPGFPQHIIIGLLIRTGAECHPLP